MIDTLREHRLEAIRALRDEYEKYGDKESVALCHRALEGNEAAYQELLEVVTDTTMGGPSDEILAEFHAECAQLDAASEYVRDCVQAENLWIRSLKE